MVVTKIKEAKSVLFLTGAALGKEIDRIVGVYKTLDYDLHVAACSAVRLAVKDGRPDWLNTLYNKLQEGHRGAFRAWLSQKEAVFTSNVWLKFNNVEGKEKGLWFSIIPGTEKLRPDRETGEFVEGGIIEAVANDTEKMFVKYSTARADRAIKSWDEDIDKKITSIISFVEKKRSEGEQIPESILATLKGAKMAVTAEVFAFRKPKQAAAISELMTGTGG